VLILLLSPLAFLRSNAHARAFSKLSFLSSFYVLFFGVGVSPFFFAAGFTSGDACLALVTFARSSFATAAAVAALVIRCASCTAGDGPPVPARGI